MNLERLPKAALNKPNIKGVEVIATERGWEAVYEGRDANEVLVEHKGLKSAIAGYAGYLKDIVTDVVDDLVDDIKDGVDELKDSVDGKIDEVKDLVGEVVGEVEDKITDLSITAGKIEVIVTEAVEDIVDVVTEKDTAVTYTRETLTALEYPLLVELAKSNEVEGRSRVDLVNGLCAVLGLA